MEATVFESFEFSEDKNLEVSITGKLSYERKEWSLDDLCWDKNLYSNAENNFIDSHINVDQIFDRLIAKVKEEMEEAILDNY